MFGPEPHESDSRETALRLTVKARLIALHVPLFAIGRWCDAWEAEAASRGLELGADTWNDGIQWILGQVAAGEDPPSD
jgi:hypothetical protein